MTFSIRCMRFSGRIKSPQNCGHAHHHDTIECDQNKRTLVPTSYNVLYTRKSDAQFFKGRKMNRSCLCVCFAIYFDYFGNSLGYNVHVRVALNYFVLFTTIKMVYTSINWIAHISAGFYSINATRTSRVSADHEMKWNERAPKLF